MFSRLMDLTFTLMDLGFVLFGIVAIAILAVVFLPKNRNVTSIGF